MIFMVVLSVPSKLKFIVGTDLATKEGNLNKEGKNHEPEIYCQLDRRRTTAP
jgi:hypothetical protein